jgi:hypothetical protein
MVISKKFNDEMNGSKGIMPILRCVQAARACAPSPVPLLMWTASRA